MSHPVATVYYISSSTSIGTVLVASIGTQIYSIILGDSESDVLNDLRTYMAKHLSTAKPLKAKKGNQLLDEALSLLKDYLNSPSKAIYKKMLQLPLYIEGTEFQKKVWQELKKIPVGQTMSYTEIAESIGSPKAVRAVANACANNRHGIVVPCHRVLRSDGGISGYRWGVERKKQLIALERKSIERE